MSDINERLAREVMGWREEPEGEYKESGVTVEWWPAYYVDSNAERTGFHPEFDWNPLQDRNHLTLVLEKFGATSTDEQRIDVVDELSGNAHTCANGGGEFWAPYDYWHLLIADPTLICQAIIKVLDQSIQTKSADN